MNNLTGRCDWCGSIMHTGGCLNRSCVSHGYGAHQSDVEPCIPEVAKAGQMIPVEDWAMAKLLTQKQTAITERQQHEQRVFDMLRAVATDTENFNAVSANNYAEQLVAEFEKRMKEQKENG